MGKMNYERANKIERTGKAQSEYASASNPTLSPEQEAALLELQEHRILEKEELRLQKELEELELRKVNREKFIANNKLLLEELSEVLECKPDCSDAWTQLQKLKNENPDEKSKYWEAYHRINEILNFN
jgi:DNA-binding Xre family transcriptional regulator